MPNVPAERIRSGAGVLPVGALWLLWSLASAVIGRTGAICPLSYCKCDDGGLRIECISSALDVVPIQLNPDVKFINLTLNHIQTVHFTLQFYYNLETLDLSGNHIGNLGSRNFESQGKLEQLILSANQIAHLAKDVFKGLVRLRTLRLNDNRIASIHFLAMPDLRALEHFDVANNSIVSLDAGTLRNCANLREIVMRQNELLDVPGENLRYARKSLRALDLSQNYIQQLNNDSFQLLGNLNVLDLSANVINAIDLLSFAPLDQLNKLLIDDNNITIMPTSQLSQLVNLTILSLSANPIETLPALSFGNLFQLRELHIDRMERLANIDPRTFIDNMQLQTLTMNGNAAVRSLPGELFGNNPKLTEIQLCGNGLTGLGADTLPIGQLRRIAVGHNPFVCNCSLLWLWQLAQPPIGDAPPSDAIELPRGQVSLIDVDNVTCELRSGDSNVRRVQLRQRSLDTMRCDGIVGVLAVVAALLTAVGLCAAIAAFAMTRVRQRRQCRRAPAHMLGTGQRPNSKIFNEHIGAGSSSLQRCANVTTDEDYYDDDDNHYEEFDDYRFGEQQHRVQHHYTPSAMYGHHPMALQPANIVYV